MKCPLCKGHSLARKEVEPHLGVEECSKCGGYWVASGAYWAWLEGHGENLPERPFSEVSLEVMDSDSAKVCPECGHILMKFEVGHGVGFRLDHCNACNGVWLDKNEWETLKARNLHDDLHRVFTTPWQKQIREEEAEAFYERLYTERLGEDMTEVKRMKAWLDGHGEKALILAYLAREDGEG